MTDSVLYDDIFYGNEIGNKSTVPEEGDMLVSKANSIDINDEEGLFERKDYEPLGYDESCERGYRKTFSNEIVSEKSTRIKDFKDRHPRKERKVHINPAFRRTKLGRKRKEEANTDEGGHSKYTKDNVLRKVKVKSKNYLIEFVNLLIVKEYGKPIYKFRNFDGETTKKIDKNTNKECLEKPLKNFLSERISQKYKKIGQDHNKRIVDKIMKRRDCALKRFLEHFNFKLFFQEIFLNNNNIIGPKYEDFFKEIIQSSHSFPSLLKKFEGDQNYQANFRKYAMSYIKHFETEKAPSS